MLDDVFSVSLSRLLAGVGLAIFCLLGLTPPMRAATVALTELDLKKVQLDSGEAVAEAQLRRDESLVLPAGSHFWIDLHGTAETFTATLVPVIGSGTQSALVRIHTLETNRSFTVAPQSAAGTDAPAPVAVSFPLKGQKLLAIEIEATADGKPTAVLFRQAAITYTDEKPESWSGGVSTSWATPTWLVTTDGRTGGLVTISNPTDTLGMNWVRADASWGTGLIKTDGFNGLWNRPSRMKRLGDRSMEIVYNTPVLEIEVRRELDGQGLLRESYTFLNTTDHDLTFGRDGLGILVPLPDDYPGAEQCLTQRCDAHLWTGGDSAYVVGLRMGGAAPHLGLVVTEGSVSDYSIHDRPQNSNDRGQFVLHPSVGQLKRGARYKVEWSVFWHQGWSDFFAKAAALPGFVRLQADRYSVVLGEPLHFKAAANTSLEKATLLIRGQEVPGQVHGNDWEADFTPTIVGEQLVEFHWGGKLTRLRAYVSPPPLVLIRQRLKFILDHQQRNEAGGPLDGAYLVYDNQSHRQIYENDVRDHNAARERIGMGVLAALYLPRCDDPAFKSRLAQSVKRYAAFLERELQDGNGTVYDTVGRSGTPRMYNYPWVAQFYLALFTATADPTYLRSYVETCRAYYRNGGENFYCIGLPIRAGLGALEKAGWAKERAELLASFRKHADVLLKNGTAYPKHEVNYEQSIVGPAAQILLEVYLVTKERAYLDGAKKQLLCLEMFNGAQPDYHLNEIAIRHWDDYWFGERKLYGDTFPHYWTTITGVVFDLYAEATEDQSYRTRANGIFANNFCSFTPDGRASCAYVYPLSVNGKAGQFFDPWANDQDWALVNWLAAQ